MGIWERNLGGESGRGIWEKDLGKGSWRGIWETDLGKGSGRGLREGSRRRIWERDLGEGSWLRALGSRLLAQGSGGVPEEKVVKSIEFIDFLRRDRPFRVAFGGVGVTVYRACAQKLARARPGTAGKV